MCHSRKMARSWLLTTTSTAGASSTLRVWAWRRLRGLGAYYLQQSVCLLPETPETTRAVNRVLARLRERSDEYGEVVQRTEEFHAEFAQERRRGRITYTELEESDADLARHARWLAAIQARDYFAAPGGDEAVDAVGGCRRALAEFEAEALRRESELAGADETLDPPSSRLRAVDDVNPHA